MVQVRVATFNCENLFARYNFKKNVKPEKAVKDGWLANQTAFELNSKEEKQITAEAIKAAHADVIALQEVENFEVLRKFCTAYLGGRKQYPYAVLIDGNDPRLIDVAILSRFPLDGITTHWHEWDTPLKSPTFSRDCLGCDVLLPQDKRLRLFVNHLKSMMDMKEPCKGRRKTRTKREHQARRVKEVVSERFPDGDGDFIVLGDMNDYLATDAQGESGITDLVCWDRVVNVVDRLPEEERWTHHFKGNKSCKQPEAYTQLDYLLVSTSLAERNPDAVPEIVRKGLAKRATRYDGPRFKGVGENSPKASDHCPVVIELKV
jgi:predicted extracellular nuclease